MSLHLDLQVDCGSHSCPDEAAIQQWANHAWLGAGEAEVCIRLVDIDEMRILNRDYRSKDKPTNVLSFCAELPPGIELDETPLGDIVVCAPVVAEEAREQHKSEDAHWAHMLIHGMLHLQGFDHIDDDEAATMEGKEIELLAELGYPSPYASPYEGAQ
jgi:probable rRNA maturation factor